jgi:hypothetical protein
VIVAKREDNSRRIAKVALIGVSELVGESGEEVVNLSRPERNGFVYWNIESATKRHSESVACRRLVKGATPGPQLTNLLERVAIDVRMRPAKQKLRKGVDSARSNLDLRSKHVCEQVALYGAGSSTGEKRILAGIVKAVLLLP